jgi:hypothetical protein
MEHNLGNMRFRRSDQEERSGRMLIRRPAVRPPTGARMPTFERAFAELGSLGDVGGVRLVPGGGGGSGPHARAGLCCSDQEHPGALGNVIISMLGVAAVALFFSTLTRSAIGAAPGTIGVLVASTVLLGLDAASHCIHSCPRATGSRSSILPRSDLVARRGARARCSTRLSGRVHTGCLGQLRHQRHRRLATHIGGRPRRGHT